MKFMRLLFRVAIAVPISFLLWTILFIGMAQSFSFSAGIALAGGILIYFATGWIMNRIFLRKHRLTWKEYAYIRKNLQEAQKKINRLRKVFFNVRSISAFGQLFRLNRLVKRIYTIVKKEPRRFYQAEHFFFYHLDSIVELTEKHAFLAAQSIKDEKMHLSLQEARQTIDQLIQSVEQDLKELLSPDMEHLSFELDVAKHTLKKWTPPSHERSANK